MLEFTKSSLDPKVFGPILEIKDALPQNILTELSTAAEMDASNILLRAATRKTKKEKTGEVQIMGQSYPQFNYGNEDHQPAVLPTPIVSTYKLGDHITLSKELYDRYDEIFDLLCEDAPDDIVWDIRLPYTHYQKLQATELDMDYPPHTDIFSKLLTCVVYLEPSESVPTSFHGKHIDQTEISGSKGKHIASGFDWDEFADVGNVPWHHNCGYVFKASNYSYHSYKNDTGELRWIYMANVE
ncbi:MAG: hypothetical protein CL489_06025 [Acidobacteria bacterium]|jgi:hypothetical protein|nr:hypothetical protein [Acidobacteriota bacterium]